TGWSVGDRVAALLSGGGHHQYVPVPAGQRLPVPDGYDLTEAAALPEVLATVWSNIVGRGRVTAGEWLLVHGGGSGIGTAAIQIARHLGVKVAVTAGSERKAEFCRELGADAVINYREEDFVARAHEICVHEDGGTGADVILDIIGAKYLERNIKALAADGRLVIIGMQGGTKTEINLGWLMQSRKSRSDLGADAVINYREEDFVARAHEICVHEDGGTGADVILDIIGAKYLERNIKALAADGRLVIIGMQGGTKTEINLGWLMQSRKS